jgi:hypothetical protein
MTPRISAESSTITTLILAIHHSDFIRQHHLPAQKALKFTRIFTPAMLPAASALIKRGYVHSTVSIIAKKFPDRNKLLRKTC